jgi:hypothetical protein
LPRPSSRRTKRTRPVRATIVTFLVSGVIHEYVFDLAAGRVLGSQMLFFTIHGLAVVATLRLRPIASVRV